MYMLVLSSRLKCYYSGYLLRIELMVMVPIDERFCEED